MSGEWVLEKVPPRKATVVTIDRGPLSERSKLGDRGLVEFRRLCDQVGISSLPPTFRLVA